jgi:hypothetical protein
LNERVLRGKEALDVESEKWGSGVNGLSHYNLLKTSHIPQHVFSWAQKGNLCIKMWLLYFRIIYHQMKKVKILTYQSFGAVAQGNFIVRVLCYC